MGKQNSGGKFKNKLFRLTLLEHDTHKSIISLKFSKLWMIVAISTAVVAIIAFIYCAIAFTPIRTTIPGYPDAKSRKTALTNAIKIDSLENSVTKWELYAENLSRILTGEQAIRYDSIVRGSEMDILSMKSREELSKADSILKESIRKRSQFEIGGKKAEPTSIEGMLFFSPIKGVIEKGFDAALHPALDIKAPKNSVVCSIYRGTVVYSGWDDVEGYVLIIQHPFGAISTYQHCEKLLIHTGEQVKAGAPIALVGNSGVVNQKEYLHFSLWYNGEAIDPVKYISF